jgi:hypothetical protein
VRAAARVTLAGRDVFKHMGSHPGGDGRAARQVIGGAGVVVGGVAGHGGGRVAAVVAGRSVWAGKRSQRRRRSDSALLRQ